MESSTPQRSSIRKAYLYDTDAGLVEMNYREWAQEHIQDSEAALRIAERLLADDPNSTSDNFDEVERIFEVYSITDRELFEAQMREYEREGEGER